MTTTTNKRVALNWVAGGAMCAGLVMAGVGPVAYAEENYEWPRYFNIITPIVGTANHSLGVAWASEFSAQTGSRARVVPAPNGYSRASWLNTGEGRIAMYQASDYFDQMDASEGYATPQGGPVDTRLINVNMITPWGYVVRGDNAIESFDDVGPGTRLAYAASSSFLLSGIDALLAYRGLDHDEVDLVEVGNYGANTAIIPEGRADVAFTSPYSGPSYEAEAGPNGIRWLPLPAREDDPEAYERYRNMQPGYVPLEVVAGVKSALGLNMDHAFQTNHVLVDEDPEFVYQLIKWMDEQHDSYKDDFTYANMMSIDSLVRFLDSGALQPLHESTIRYLKEKDLWKDAYQERQDALVSMAEERVALYQEAMAEAKDRGIAIEPSNEEWVELWHEYRDKQSGGQSYGAMVLALD